MGLVVAEGWFEARDVGDGVSLIEETHVHPYMRCNIWLVRGRDRDLLIDSGSGLRRLRGDPVLGGRPVVAAATHIHFDHVGCLHEFDDRRAHEAEADDFAEMRDAVTLAPMFRAFDDPVSALPHAGWTPAGYRIEPAPITDRLQDGDRIDLGDRVLTVLHLPGHSPGSVGFFEEATGLLFSGDALYEGDVYDNLPCSEVATYEATMRRLLALPIRLGHGGHGPSFDEARKNELAADYLAGRRRQGCPQAWLDTLV